MRLWTIQSKEVVETIRNEDIWIPDFSKSTYPEKVPGFRELYDFVLAASNKNNNRQDKGLVFCFMEIKGNEVHPIGQGIDSFINFVNNNFNDLQNIWNVLFTDDCYIMELEVDLGSYFPTLIELNDWNLMAYGVDLPSYPVGYNQYIREQIMNKKITISDYVHSNVMQVHLPFIRKDDVVKFYSH